MDHQPEKSSRLQKGMAGLLNVTGQHFQVIILDVGPDTVRVTFPGKDYPIEGISATLELHDETGFFYYPLEVVQGPSNDSQGILLRQLPNARRNTHRASFRAPTDLTVRVKEQVHIRRYDAALVNISGGGALLRTEAPFDFSSLIEMTVSLPGERQWVILGQVIHIAESVSRDNVKNRFVGVRFLDLDPDVQDAIMGYVWQRMRELYPTADLNNLY